MNREDMVYTWPVLDTRSILDVDLVEDTIKPKRKYTRKAKPVVEAVKVDDRQEKYNLDIVEERKKLKKEFSMGGGKSNRTRQAIINYLTFVVKHLSPDLKFNIYIEQTDNYHYLGARVTIEIENETYTQYQVIFTMEELHFNCSSVGIHHMSGQMTPYECTAKHVFKDAKDVNTFLGEVVEICKVFGYSNILYTISNESCKYLTTFVKENAKEILSFKSKRSSNKITYYSQLI